MAIQRPSSACRYNKVNSEHQAIAVELEKATAEFKEFERKDIKYRWACAERLQDSGPTGAEQEQAGELLAPRDRVDPIRLALPMLSKPRYVEGRAGSLQRHRYQACMHVLMPVPPYASVAART